MGKSIPGRGNSNCKGLEVKIHVAYSRNSKEANVCGAEKMGGGRIISN